MSKSATTTSTAPPLRHADDDGSDWTVAKHVAAFAPNGNIDLLDMRHMHAGWSLRIKQPVAEMPSSAASTCGTTTLIRIPWEHVLDKPKAEGLILALHRLLLLDSSRHEPLTGNDTASATTSSAPTAALQSRRQLLDFFASSACDSKPELVFASALLAARQIRKNPNPVFDGLPPVPLGRPQEESSHGDVLQEAAATVRQFLSRFHWVHDVIDECGDLGIPLLWGEFAASSRAASDDMSPVLFCDTDMHRRVMSDVNTLKELKAVFEGTWAHYGLLPRTLLPSDCSRLFGTVPEMLRYVAWIRSRWVCFLTPPTCSDSANKQKKSKKSTSLTLIKRNPTSFAVCPLVEKLNHHSESLICPTIDAGVSVCVVVDQAIRGDLTAPNQLRCSGDEVFITYGNHTNAYLLEHYGFLMTPSHTNPSEALILALPLPPSSELGAPELLDRWCIASDSLVHQWRWTPRGTGTEASGGASVPVNVLFTVAVTVCLGVLEQWSLLTAPPAATTKASVAGDGVDEDENCFHLGCLGEGASDDDELEDAGTSWFFDTDRMLRFIQKKDVDIAAEMIGARRHPHLLAADGGCPIENIDDADDANAMNSECLSAAEAALRMDPRFDVRRPLTSLALSELAKFVRRDIVHPARTLLDNITQWKSDGSKEVTGRLAAHQSSLFWAATYAEERLRMGEDMLRAIDAYAE